jgi:ribosomal protein S18 acetylase RimI-like enzyme
MTSIRKATQRDIPFLSRKFHQFLEDKNSQIYQENVAKFGIPEEYVRKAFEKLLKAVSSGEATLYLALEKNEIMGFAQIIEQNSNTAELDRILVFPEHAGEGIGTRLLNQAVLDQKERGANTIIVKAGKEETHARRFYEKNGFKLIKEETIQAPWGRKLDLAIYQLRLNS